MDTRAIARIYYNTVQLTKFVVGLEPQSGLGLKPNYEPLRSLIYDHLLTEPYWDILMIVRSRIKLKEIGTYYEPAIKNPRSRDNSASCHQNAGSLPDVRHNC